MPVVVRLFYTTTITTRTTKKVVSVIPVAALLFYTTTITTRTTKKVFSVVPVVVLLLYQLSSFSKRAAANRAMAARAGLPVGVRGMDVTAMKCLGTS